MKSCLDQTPDLLRYIFADPAKDALVLYPLQLQKYYTYMVCLLFQFERGVQNRAEKEVRIRARVRVWNPDLDVDVA